MCDIDSCRTVVSWSRRLLDTTQSNKQSHKSTLRDNGMYNMPILFTMLQYIAWVQYHQYHHKKHVVLTWYTLHVHTNCGQCVPTLHETYVVHCIFGVRQLFVCQIRRWWHIHLIHKQIHCNCICSYTRTYIQLCIYAYFINIYVNVCMQATKSTVELVIYTHLYTYTHILVYRKWLIRVNTLHTTHGEAMLYHMWCDVEYMLAQA